MVFSNQYIEKDLFLYIFYLQLIILFLSVHFGSVYIHLRVVQIQCIVWHLGLYTVVWQPLCTLKICRYQSSIFCITHVFWLYLLIVPAKINGGLCISNEINKKMRIHSWNVCNNKKSSYLFCKKVWRGTSIASTSLWAYSAAADSAPLSACHCSSRRSSGSCKVCLAGW